MLQLAAWDIWGPRETGWPSPASPSLLNVTVKDAGTGLDYVQRDGAQLLTSYALLCMAREVKKIAWEHCHK